ncbi:GroES-like protein [Ceraceosorus guamensis]|uniref:GroES-like protein n=1 Tax=Ceraceosorus guamensis TaxID=1522189 RepID=A0A316W1F0_9BASI|nr:GroES-like protein [Ceraceosorus guamensis]PWN42391.1 GroES-like protein [Ceraceosorus guamensis]
MSVPRTFKSAIVEAPRAKTVIKDVPTPEPKPDEVLIKITAAAINPVDWKMRDEPDTYPYLKEYPTPLGSDAAGIVAAVGSSVDSSHLKVGDPVFFQGIIGNPRNSTLQQYAVMPAELAALRPSNITEEEAAGISLASACALVGMYHDTSSTPTKPGPWEPKGDAAGKGKALVVLGGSSSVGQYVIQLARLSGYTQIITGSSPSHHEHLKQLGATAVLDRNVADATHYVSALRGLAVDYVYDAISEESTNKLAIEILQRSSGNKTGKLNMISVIPPSQAVKAEAKQAGVDISFILGMGSLPHVRPISVPFFKALTGWLKEGKFVPNRTRLINGGLPAIEQALEANKTASGVKIIIRPHDA